MAKLTKEELNEALSELTVEELFALETVKNKVGAPRKFTITALPESLQNHPEADSFSVHVLWRGGDNWAVEANARQYTKDLKGGWESGPSSRTERFKKSHRFLLTQALEIAHRLAPKIKVNGLDAEGFTYWDEASELHDEYKKANPDTKESAHFWILAKIEELKKAGSPSTVKFNK